MKNTISKDENTINDIFTSLKNRADTLYKFISMYNEFMNQPKDYGTGELISMVEVHILTIIEENPGINITQLSKIWNRTKGAVSQTVTKLEKKGYIERIKRENNAKNVLLMPTNKGIELSKAHKLYDTIDMTKTFEYLMRICTIEEIDAFYKVVDKYITLLDD